LCRCVLDGPDILFNDKPRRGFPAAVPGLADSSGQPTPWRSWQGTGGFSLDASVRIHGSDRAGGERLIRYWTAAPYSPSRLSSFSKPSRA
jgi:hypothetical protein